MDSGSQTRLRISGMDCAACAVKIETALQRIPGISSANVSSTAGTATVSHDGQVAPDTLIGAIAQLGYGAEALPGREPRPTARPSTVDHHEHHDNEPAGLHGHGHGPIAGPWWRTAKAQLTIICTAALGLAFLAAQLIPAATHWAFVIAMAIGLAPIAFRALQAARAGTPFSIETLMSIAAIGAVLIGAAEEAAVVVVLFLFGELLEGVAAGKARASIQGLTALVPKTALVEQAGKTIEVEAETLTPGMVILVRPGDRIAADGKIVEGASAIDEAPVTGESTPVRKVKGDDVFAGTINTDGVLRVKVSAATADNTIARVIRLVEEAQEAKAPTERFIDRFSRYYTPVVLLVGTLVAAVPPLLMGSGWSEWIYKGLAILLIGCPCALVISVPAAIASGLSAGARRGLLLKGGAVLERLGSITTVAFDKTGTLTAGRPKVTDIVGYGLSEADVLGLAAALETGSSHPLAFAILARAKDAGIVPVSVSGASAIGGKGVSGRVNGETLFLGAANATGRNSSLTQDQLDQISLLNDAGKTVSVLSSGGRAIGLIAMRDEPRPDARSGLEALRALGIKTVMLTGDNARTAKAIGDSLGIEPRGQLLPEDKQRIVRELKEAGERVAKVGDGINDAPALAAADVGIAMGGGTDVALETADAAVLHARVMDIAAMVMLSRRTLANIRQNITIALGLKAVFLVTTIIGVTGLWPAILADTGATVLVTANAMRLLSIRLNAQR